MPKAALYLSYEEQTGRVIYANQAQRIGHTEPYDIGTKAKRNDAYDTLPSLYQAPMMPNSLHLRAYLAKFLALSPTSTKAEMKTSAA